MKPEPAIAESERLRQKIELALPELLDATRKFVDDPRLAELYPEYLFMIHCVIRASVPLMEAALGRARSIAETDPVAARLAVYLENHIVEELDHDEWLLEDLAVLQVEPATILARPPSATVAALVGAQYYWILHYHPVALLGYIALLEGYPPTTEHIDGLIARTGHNPDAFRTLLKHAQLDPHHGAELAELVDSLPLTPEQSAVIGLSGMLSVHMAARAFKEILGAGR